MPCDSMDDQELLSRMPQPATQVYHLSPQTANPPLLVGHSSLAVLQRYLALAGEDIERAHKLHSPLENLL